MSFHFKYYIYVAMCGDFIHSGHIELLKEASKYGHVIVGLLTDEAMATYKRLPIMTYEQREAVVKSIKFVSLVVPQDTLDYTKNLQLYKPKYVIHGDDWKTGVQAETRAKVIETLKEWEGVLVEMPVKPNRVSSTRLSLDYKEHEKFERQAQLRLLLQNKPLLRVIEAHSGLSAIIGEKAKRNDVEFDAIWISSFTDSASKGKPDIELIDFTSRLQTINEVLEVTTKPLIVDGDTGGSPEHFSYMVKTLERLGVSAVVIEDKEFPKRNSLIDAPQKQISSIAFARKIVEGNKAKISKDFLIFARIESLICGKRDALKRANTYISAGASGIVIHSRSTNDIAVKNFSVKFKKQFKNVPLIIIPTTYKPSNTLLQNVNMIIYANQLLAISFRAMQYVAYVTLAGVNLPFSETIKRIMEVTKCV